MALLERLSIKSDSPYIDGIRVGKSSILEKIYHNYFPLVEKFILNNSGNIDDAKDVFQDTLLVIYHHVCKEDFRLTCKFGTYLLGISKRMWMKQLRNKQKLLSTSMEDEFSLSEEEFNDSLDWLMRYRLFRKTFLSISQKCQELLELYLQGADMASIAKKFGFASVSYARKRKFKCKEQLIKRVKEDFEFQQLKFQ